jgi:hypothetical protein
VAVEILIFSCRTTGWFFLDMPSMGLVAGVMAANVIVSVCAVYGVVVSPHLNWTWVANIWGYNLLWLFAIDAVKVAVNRVLGNAHDDILGYAEMPERRQGAVGANVAGGRPSHMSNASAGSEASGRLTDHSRPSARASAARRSHLQHRLSADPAGAARASYQRRSSSLRPSLPGNLARDFGSSSKPAWGGYAATASDLLEDAAFAASAPAADPLLRRLN